MLDLGDKRLTDAKLKVLYVAGRGHSGSTILSRILACPDAVVAVGEINSAWSRIATSKRVKVVPGKDDPAAAEFWNDIFAQIESEMSLDEIQAMAASVNAAKMPEDLDRQRF